MSQLDTKIIIIDCFANNVEKINLLKRCISSLKPLNWHILLVSHSVVPEDVIRSVNYYVYDYDNTLSDVYSGSYWWAKYPGYEIHVNIRPPFFELKGHEYPIIKSIRNALSLADANKYDTFCFVEFDNTFNSYELEKINNIFLGLNSPNNKFFFFEEGDHEGNKRIGTTFFGGYTSDFLKIFNSYFPFDIKSYNEKFSIKYPFNLERFFYEMMVPYMNEFNPIKSDTFYTYFVGDTKNMSNCGDVRAWILSDGNAGYYLMVSNDNKIEYKVRVKHDNKVLHENKFYSSVYPALKLENEGDYIIEYLSCEDVLLKSIMINFNLKNEIDYINQGTIKLL